ncbi:MAG: hypothetical protein V7K32_02665 [Nostoc sp.]
MGWTSCPPVIMGGQDVHPTDDSYPTNFYGKCGKFLVEAGNNSAQLS